MKRMIQLPPFDNNSYVWQGKDWKKINIYSNKNLASPDLEGKEYLGGGDYRLYQYENFTIDYNVYNGVYIFNGTKTGPNFIYIFQPVGSYVKTLTLSDKTGSFTQGSFNFDLGGSPNLLVPYNDNNNQTITNFQELSAFNLYIPENNITFNNFQFKLQLEKGDTVTPYTPPAAPVKYYLEHDYEPLTIDGFINYDNKIFSDFKTLKEHKK